MRTLFSGTLILQVVGCVFLLSSLGVSVPTLAQSPSTRGTVKAQKVGAVSSQSSASDWWRRAVFYEIFVRSFQDSNGDGVGDINGLISRLDYLNDGNPATTTDLGINALWLMPVFRSPSYHGYDTTDYYNINPAYGTDQDFRRLLKEAHRRGIRVVVDLVINHSSSQHPWFLAARAKQSPYRQWYIWRNTNPGWTQPWGPGRVWHPLQNEFFYGVFWGGMPDFNFRHPPVRKEMIKIAKHWLRQGVDGFRLDAARYLVANGPGASQSDQSETHDYWKSFRRAVKKEFPQAALIGEIWTSAANIAPYCHGDEMDQAFHFPLASAIKSAAASMTAAPLWRALSRTIPVTCWATFLTNHDQERILSQLHGNLPMMRAAAAMLLTLPGPPFLYYGEEIGMTNGPTRDDRDKRTPMAWDADPRAGFTAGKPWYKLTPHKQANVASQRNKPQSLLSWYRRLIHVRQQHPALSLGSLTRVAVSGDGSDAVVAFVRQHGGQRLLVLLHLEDQSQASVQITLPFATKRWKTVLLQGSGQVTHIGTTTLPTDSPNTLATPRHTVKMGPTSVWIVQI